ncbi:hypothetical protein LTS18_010274 [Coniosporium uncinatum]|uniref:Uncharacterized protein n=1 Tax=Coniosporium uncinatum TaxID=93489 RepID=A0ACC3DLP9_9PEZI|nr:hypothetical protein LTS18_010274 [Coniosporium uncinatum]
MAPAANDADVLFNRANVALAKSQRLISSWLGESSNGEVALSHGNGDKEDEEFEYEPELLGVGAPRPTNKDEALPRRDLSSLEKLQRELLGKDAAAKLLKQKQLKMRSNGLPAQQSAPPKNTTNSRPLREEQSEDEDEGRTASFKSKRAKTAILKVSHQDYVNQTAPEASSKKRPATEAEAAESDSDDDDEQQIASTSVRNTPSGGPKKGPSSFLDEMLSEKAKKWKKKKKKQKVGQTSQGGING